MSVLIDRLAGRPLPRPHQLCARRRGLARLLAAGVLALGLGGVGLVGGAVPATAVGGCSGTRIDTYPITDGGTRVAEIALYYDASTDTNCAATVHVGPTYGKRLTTTVIIETSAIGGSIHQASDSGSHAYYAGPATGYARHACLYLYGSVSYHGSRAPTRRRCTAAGPRHEMRSAAVGGRPYRGRPCAPYPCPIPARRR